MMVRLVILLTSVTISASTLSAAASQCPEQLRLVVVVRCNELPVRQNNLRADKIVERQAEAADQWTVATAQGEAGHANGAD